MKLSPRQRELRAYLARYQTEHGGLPRMAGASTFPTVSLKDTLERVLQEAPYERLGEGAEVGTVERPSWISAGGGLHTALGQGWNGASTSLRGVYLHKETFSEPASRVEMMALMPVAGRVALIACAQSPSAETSYYEFRIEREASEYFIQIIRWIAGTSHVVGTVQYPHSITGGTKLGQTVTSGVLAFWVGETIVLEVEDSTYTSGYIGFSSQGSTGPLLINWEAASQETTSNPKAVGSDGPGAGGGVARPRWWTAGVREDRSSAALRGVGVALAVVAAVALAWLAWLTWVAIDGARALAEAGARAGRWARGR